ncbi:hypothetical protein [Obesumbacterium proteus]|uniref:Uncharacterized protein n=1 Tax=Obesumbacterium proteus ATCC 12841 TaxID=1354268 RepID=A0AA91EIX3_9GAMM|nr:hypothetical protein [Obesumbacterium proteus]OAT58611.1 hypothetical protein M993_02733 [Obesumbacterium proteus ATCC 12841]
MRDFVISTGNYCCSYTLAESEGDKTVGLVVRRDDKSGNVTILSQLDEHGVALVDSLVTELRASQCQTVVIPSIWKHYSCSKVAEIYERAMDEAGVKWRSVDDKPAITKRSQNNGDH